MASKKQRARLKRLEQQLAFDHPGVCNRPIATPREGGALPVAFVVAVCVVAVCVVAVCVVAVRAVAAECGLLPFVEFRCPLYNDM